MLISRSPAGLQFGESMERFAAVKAKLLAPIEPPAVWAPAQQGNTVKFRKRLASVRAKLLHQYKDNIAEFMERFASARAKLQSLRVTEPPAHQGFIPIINPISTPEITFPVSSTSTMMQMQRNDQQLEYLP